MAPYPAPRVIWLIPGDYPEKVDDRLLASRVEPGVPNFSPKGWLVRLQSVVPADKAILELVVNERLAKIR
jgi:hypothetical protein